MKNALILHGTFSTSKDNWFPWLGDQLKRIGYKVWVPDLPHADKPNVQRYNEFIFSKWTFDEDSIIIGHSSGAVAILGILQDLPEKVIIDKAILVAGFVDDLQWDPLKELFIKPFNWEKIKQHAKQFILFHSDNDPYVALSHGKILKEKLGAELVVLPAQKHFSTEGDPKYIHFPEVLAQVE